MRELEDGPTNFARNLHTLSLGSSDVCWRYFNGFNPIKKQAKTTGPFKPPLTPSQIPPKSTTPSNKTAGLISFTCMHLSGAENSLYLQMYSVEQKLPLSDRFIKNCLV